MKEKVLILASVASMIQQFNMRNVKILLEMGYDVDVACNFREGNTCAPEQIIALEKELKEHKVAYYQIDFARNVFKILQNVKAYRQLKKIFAKNHYRFIHCQSPIGGVIGRLVAHKYKCRAIYTAHGFHFFKGAPKINWLLFYPIEKFLSRYTDELLVINQEDYNLARRKFCMKHLTYVPGIGVNVKIKNISKETKTAKREKLGIPGHAFLIICVAEFTPNKNQKTVIEALEKIDNPNIYYVMCGIGPQKEELEQYVTKHNLGKNIKFLGFRKDVHEILQCSDCFVLPSFREGLSVALMEAMSEGLPIVCGNIRGNVDLIEDGVGGFLVRPGEEKEFREAFTKLLESKANNSEQFAEMGQANRRKIISFGEEEVDKIMCEVYNRNKICKKDEEQ